MAKTVTHLDKFTDPIQPDIGPDKRLLVARCDDGSVYEFQKFDDSPKWSMKARGSLDEEPSRWTQRRAPLPTDLKESMNELVGKNRWTK